MDDAIDKVGLIVSKLWKKGYACSIVREVKSTHAEIQKVSNYESGGREVYCGKCGRELVRVRMSAGKAKLWVMIPWPEDEYD
jgi:hypothetical protein